ncbi:MAG TPA: phosphotransferase, partial [Kofleriaceae bacterium]|nr:phosphotransferase [Kofleriaceae bacterium]
MTMHADEIHTDDKLVTRLLAGQFPHWAHLLIQPVASAGTDNALYRLGDDMVVRLPRIHGAVESLDKEHQWLPRLAPLLPVAIPGPLAKGAPAEGYPWHWSVYRWLEGENPTIDHHGDSRRLAADLASFIAALQR